MLLNCELIDESKEEEQRKRMAYKSEERLKIKAAQLKPANRAVGGGTRQRATINMRHTVAVARADSSKRTGFIRANNTDASTAAQQQQRDRRQGGKEIVIADPKRTTSSSSRSPTSSPTAASASTSPSDAVDPLAVYHPYIVRSIHSGKLLPIRGPPLPFTQPALLPSPFVPSAAVMCVTQQSAYHKGGTLLVTFTLQRGMLIELKHKRTTDDTSSSSSSGSGSSEAADERIWRVKLFHGGMQGRRGGGITKDIAQQFLYPLGDNWRQRYGLPPDQPADADTRASDRSGQALKDEEADNDDDDDSDAEGGSGSGGGQDVARTRSVPELVDLVDDSDESTNPTPDPLNEPHQPQQQNGHRHKQPSSSGDMMDDGDDGCEVLIERQFDHNNNNVKQLSTPTLHATADTDTPSSPLPFPLTTLDERTSSPDLPASPSPSPSPTLPLQPLTSPHTARLQLVLPMSPTHAPHGEGQEVLDGGLGSHAMEAQVEAEAEVEEEDEPGLLPDKRRASGLKDIGRSKHVKSSNGCFAASAFGSKAEGEDGVSIFAMMSTS